jgi:hypothetical protein
MRRGTLLVIISAAAGLAGCGSPLGTPDGGARGDACNYQVQVEPLTGMSCRFAVPALPVCDQFGADRTHIGVLVGGGELPRDPAHTNGWDYTDQTMEMIEIHGPSCDAITAAPTIPVIVVFKLLIP